jgi:hypothetical protein
LVFSGTQDFAGHFLESPQKTIYVDASQGLTEVNLKILREYFPHLSLQENIDKESKQICWIRNPLFPYASGVCQKRLFAYSMKGGLEDINRIDEDKTTAKVLETHGKIIFLVTSSLDLKNASNEELCLSAIKNGHPCAAVEVLPSASTSALSVTTKDPTIEMVLEEFNVSSSRELAESLGIYSPKNSLTTESIEVKNINDILPCGGLLMAAPKLLGQYF